MSTSTSTSTPTQPNQKQQLIKLTILACRNPKLSEAEFHHYWTNIHAPKASAHLAKFGIVKYRQYHTPSHLRQSIVDKVPSMGMNVASEVWAEYDGYAELLMPNLECFERARRDQYYLDVVAPDEEYFADWTSSKITVGWEEVWIENGKVIDEEGEKEI